MARDDPSSVYAGQVSDIIAATPRDSTYRPAEPLELSVKDRRAITSIDQLEPDELAQLTLMFPEGLKRAIAEGIEDMPIDLEVAHVVDETGALRFRWWNEKCWDDIKDAAPGTLQSEPYIRKQFAGTN